MGIYGILKVAVAFPAFLYTVDEVVYLRLEGVMGHIARIWKYGGYRDEIGLPREFLRVEEIILDGSLIPEDLNGEPVGHYAVPV